MGTGCWVGTGCLRRRPRPPHPGPGSLGVVRVNRVKEILQFFLVEDTVCKEELELLQGQLPIICKAGREGKEQLVSNRRDTPNPGTPQMSGELQTYFQPAQEIPKLHSQRTTDQSS